MARFAPDTVERVKDAADMVEIVSAHTDLRRKGERYEGLCPFHEERTPSFSVDPHQKLYHCFGCQVGGDVFQFVQEKEGLSFPEAVERLGERYGVEVEREREDPRAEEARRRRERLGELLERTAAFYVSFLWESEKAAKARTYLAERGLGEEALREFGVGFAPSAWDQVLTRGQRAGYSVEEMRSAGLVQKGQKGGFYDRFRKRIVFPVRDPRGRVMGFGARWLGEDAKGPKYLNSPEGVFRKSEMLFGIDQARQAIARGGRAVVVEGYTDVLALHQAGITEAVAVMGTAITPDQLKSLSRYTEEVVLAMDADRAGEDAMIRAQRVAGARRMRLRVAEMPKGVDPADMVGEGSAERMSELIEAAVDLSVFQVHAALDRAELGTGAGRDRALDEVAPVLAAMDPDSVSRQELVRTVADRLDTDPGLVMRRVEREGRGDRRAESAPAARESAPERAAKPEPPRSLGARERRERALLAMCIGTPAEGKELLGRLTAEHMSSPLTARALEWTRGHLDDPMAGLPRDDEELVSVVTQLVMDSQREPGSRDAMELNFLWLEQALLEDQIAAAQQNGGDPPVDLQRRRADVAQRIAHWESAPEG
ncbi:MAG TPA: DNA primase [Solirubrobacterales bacterium]|nr:DNA primase [Solirubrobacterales bacterium]